MPEIYQDFALMRIVEPASKLRTLELLEWSFNIRYAERTAYRMLPKILSHQEAIETSALQTARNDLGEPFGLLRYNVTTRYFELFKEYDFQHPGFLKDNKPMQPQIVISLTTTRSRFPVMHEVFEVNAFEGHTMLVVLRRAQDHVGDFKQIIVADAALLSKANMLQLDKEGYHYIVGARLANASHCFIERTERTVLRTDKAWRHFDYGHAIENAALICEFSEARFKKEKMRVRLAGQVGA